MTGHQNYLLNPSNIIKDSISNYLDPQDGTPNDIPPPTSASLKCEIEISSEQTPLVVITPETPIKREDESSPATLSQKLTPLPNIDQKKTRIVKKRTNTRMNQW